MSKEVARFGAAYALGRGCRVTLTDKYVEVKGMPGKASARVPRGAITAVTVDTAGTWPYRYAQLSLVGEGTVLGWADVYSGAVAGGYPAKQAADWLNERLGLN